MLSHDSETIERGRIRWLWLAPSMVFSAIVFYPVTQSYFYADDFLNLYQIVNDRFLQYWVTPNGGHIHLVRNTIFYLTDQMAGTHPAPYYWSGFLTHLVNVWLLFRLIQLLTHSSRLASFGAALWGISPFNEGTLGFYSVYGHALVGTMVLVLLYQASRAAAAARAPSRRTLWLWYALALIAANCFGTGLGVALALPFVLYVVLPPPAGLPARRLPPLISLLVVVPVLYALVYWAYRTLLGSPDFFQPSPSLMSTAVPVFLSHLIALGLTRLLLGAYFPAWVTTGVWYGVLACFALALIVVLRRSDGSVRRQIAACTLLLLAAYGTVALGRTFLMSNWPMSVFVQLSRYHYVGQLLLTIMLCIVLNQLAPTLPERVRTLALVAWYAAAVFAYARFGTPIDRHLKAQQDTEAALASMHEAIAAQPAGQPVYITNRLFAPLPLPPTMFPGWAGAFVIFHADNSVDGRRIYFVENSPVTRASGAPGRRTRTLLVPPSPPSGS